MKHDNTPCAVDELNQLVQEGDCQFTYNADGCLTQRTTPTEEIHYTYDSVNRLTSVETPTTKIIFTYDSLDRRLSKTVHDLNTHSQTTTRYLFDGHHEIGAVDKNGTIVELRVLRQGLGAEIGAVVAIEINGYVYAPIHDHRGNVVTLLYTNYFGNCSPYENYRYSAFGEEKILQTTSINPWRFSSKRTENDLVFFGRRIYDPVTGRWLSPDPEGYQDGPNLYTYVHNSPLSYVDFFGLAAVDYQDRFSLVYDNGGAFFSAKEGPSALQVLPHKNLFVAPTFQQMHEAAALASNMSCVQDVGSRPLPRGMITFINGIRNDLSDAKADALMISR